MKRSVVITKWVVRQTMRRTRNQISEITAERADRVRDRGPDVGVVDQLGRRDAPRQQQDQQRDRREEDAPVRVGVESDLFALVEQVRGDTPRAQYAGRGLRGVDPQAARLSAPRAAASSSTRASATSCTARGPGWKPSAP